VVNIFNVLRLTALEMLVAEEQEKHMQIVNPTDHPYKKQMSEGQISQIPHEV